MQKLQGASLTLDLEQLLNVGYALRSIDEDSILNWLMNKNELIRPKNPYPESISQAIQKTFGIEKEYEVETPSNEKYTFVLLPEYAEGITNNSVKVRYTKTHKEGINENIGEKTRSGHNVLYLLPWIINLPVPIIGYETVRNYFETENGFETEMRRPEESIFWDKYQFKRKDEYGFEETDNLDVYVRIKPTKTNQGEALELSLEVQIPQKRIR